MPLRQKSGYLNDTSEGAGIRATLQEMVENIMYNTVASYSSNADLYPDHSMPFVEKHMQYLNTHPQLDPRRYLANLRLMTRIR